MKKIIIAQILVNFIFALHGKIVFYDGTYVVGKVTKVDEAAVYIVPIGLDTAEGVLVGNIDSLKVENGMVPVINSAVKYFYQGGEFLANNSDWMDEYDDFKYDDYSTLQQDYKYEETKKKNTSYSSFTLFGAYPVIKLSSLSDSLKKTKLQANLGFGYQFPYYPFGAVDISPGFKIMTFGFSENPELGLVNAVQFAPALSIDFKPIFFFLPKPLHPIIDFGLSYNIGFKVEPNSDQYEGEPTYSGVGYNLGASMDYHLPELPIALKVFATNAIIPQSIPFPDLKTGFITFGMKLIVVLKRHK